MKKFKTGGEKWRSQETLPQQTMSKRLLGKYKYTKEDNDEESRQLFSVSC